jgi:hypothetical protein
MDPLQEELDKARPIVQAEHRRKTTMLALRNQRGEQINWARGYRTEAPGLIACKRGATWTVTHEASGLALGSFGFTLREQAMDFCAKIAYLRDWTRSESELTGGYIEQRDDGELVPVPGVLVVAYVLKEIAEEVITESKKRKEEADATVRPDAG